MIRLLVTKGEDLDGEHMFLRSEQNLRVSFTNIWKNQQIMIGMDVNGNVIVKGKRDLENFNTPLENLFEGTYEEFIARIVQ